MKNYKFLIIILVIIFIVSSCETNEDKKFLGGLIGAAVGAYVGSEVGSGIGKNITTIIGGTIGYYLGTKAAGMLDVDEQESFNESIEKTLNENENEKSSQWVSNKNPDKIGIITPLNNYSKNDTNCRDFKKIITYEDKIVEEISKACRDSEGNWKIIENL